MLDDEEVSTQEYDDRRYIGAKLREARLARGLSLAALPEASDDVFRASAVASYERGERAVAASRLVALARFYGVAVESLVPPVSALAEQVAVMRKAMAALAPVAGRLQECAESGADGPAATDAMTAVGRAHAWLHVAVARAELRSPEPWALTVLSGPERRGQV